MSVPYVVGKLFQVHLVRKSKMVLCPNCMLFIIYFLLPRLGNVQALMPSLYIVLAKEACRLSFVVVKCPSILYINSENTNRIKCQLFSIMHMGIILHIQRESIVLGTSSKI